MKTLIFRFFPVSFVSIFALSFAVSPVLAHGDEPRLEISSDRMNPGGVIEVRGVDFEFEEVVALALIGPELEIAVGEIAADTEGVFLHIATLPVDLKEGAYYFRAITDDHEILSPVLLVQGPAIMNEEGGGQGQRDEDDGLLAPMPTFAPGVSPTQPAQSASPTAPVSNGNQKIITISILVVVGIFMVFGFRRMKKQ